MKSLSGGETMSDLPSRRLERPLVADITWLLGFADFTAILAPVACLPIVSSGGSQYQFVLGIAFALGCVLICTAPMRYKLVYQGHTANGVREITAKSWARCEAIPSVYRGIGLTLLTTFRTWQYDYVLVAIIVAVSFAVSMCVHLSRGV
jgi:hypothetical protein